LPENFVHSRHDVNRSQLKGVSRKSQLSALRVDCVTEGPMFAAKE
jgi:hypothetical protein